ncbi:MAG: recombination regulator RecX [Lachnospiraceae bacterium]|nr:recombination regulator RecX [Lachnospiraceae bacterium]
MYISGIERLPRKKNRIYIDGEYAFMLYDSDLKQYHIEADGLDVEDGSENGIRISDELYTRILKETVIRRAHQKALAILERMDRSEAELRQKLKTDMYSEEVADETIAWLKQLHYLDDSRYAQSYIRNRIDNSSRQELLSRLRAKGVDKETADEAYMICRDELNAQKTGKGLDPDAQGGDCEQPDPEQQAAFRLLAKKLGTDRNITLKEQRSAIGYMLRKGFRRNEIVQAFEALGLKIDYEE